MKKWIPIVLMLALAMGAQAVPTDYINGIIGSSSTGRAGGVPPGAHTPFGMVLLSPDTDTINNTAGYNYNETTIEGFSMNHMSGVGWKGTLSNFEIMPTTGAVKFHSGSNSRDIYQPGTAGWKSTFNHANETAEAGYYKVKLDTYNIWTELTCTPRTGMLRFTFPASSSSTVQIDLSRKIGGRSELQHNYVVENGTIKGWIKCWGTGEGFAQGTFYILYYYAQFDKSWDSYGLWNAGTNLGAVADVENEDLGFYANFNTTANEQIQMRVGISYVSMEGAQANLEQELNHWNFDATRNNARADWNNAISGALDVSGGTEDQKTIFYTGMYHAMTYPCIFSDVDGAYFGADKQVYTNDTSYTTRMGFSGWDVYRHEFPLLTLIRPDVVNDEVNTFLDICNLTGKTYPLWQLTGDYTGAGLGDPGLSVVADAYMKGIRNYDVERAYEIALQEATGPDSTRYYPDDMNSVGYVYSHPSINITLTLENTYGDWCIGRMAGALGHTNDAAFYGNRAANNYKKLFDPAVGWMRQKDAAGNWKTAWTDKFARDGCKEGNTYQWTFFVPHDVQGLIDLMGESTFTSELEDFFNGAMPDFPPGNPYYNQGNEPVHQIVSYFNFAGQPWRTQYWTRQVLDRAYGTDQFGLPHNDDFGQLSAWYILNAIGLNPVAPGENLWHIGSPVFDEVVIPLNRNYHRRTIADTFTITAENNSPNNMYIQSATLNGEPFNRPWLTHEELIAGGQLVLVMGPSVSTWGSDVTNRPPSASSGTFPSAVADVVAGPLAMPYRRSWGPRILLPSMLQAADLASFNVTNFMAQVSQLDTAEYVMINLHNGHGGSFYCSPYPELSAILDPSLFPTRDLFGEVLDALEADGKKALVYFSSVGIDETYVSSGIWSNWTNHIASLGMGHREAVAKLILKYYAETYGDKIDGWWFDRVGSGPMTDQEMQWFEDAARAGNPNAILAFNTSAGSPLLQDTPYCDYTGGHPVPMAVQPPWTSNNVAMVEDIEAGPWLDQAGLPATPCSGSALGQIFMPLQTLWAGGATDFPTAQATEWMTRVLNAGGMYTWAVARSGSGFAATQFNQMLAMNAAVAATINWPPLGLIAVSGDGSVALDWEDSTNAGFSSYKVYRSTNSFSYGAALATGVTASGYIDNTVVNGTTYYYVVTAIDTASNESARGNEASASPDAPTGVLVVSIENNVSGTAAWTMPSLAGPSATDYADASQGNGVTITNITGTLHANGAVITALVDGEAQATVDQPAKSVWFSTAAPNRFLMDLKGLVSINEINTYSWHRNVRANQTFDLYYSPATVAPDASTSTTDLAGNGWTLLTSVDTGLPTTQTNQVVVSIHEQSGGTLIDARHLLWDVKYNNTFYGEIDVVGTPVPTTVTNGVPKAWLASYGLPETDEAALADADFDGLLAWQEYYAGTNPTNGASVLKITGMNPVGDQLVFDWQAVSGKTYSIWFSTNLTDSAWILQDSGIIGIEPSTTSTIQTDNATGFIRIGVE